MSAANRVIGGLQALNDSTGATQIKRDMSAAGYILSPVNPFDDKRLFLASKSRIASPYSGRISAMWEKMREDIVKIFPSDPGLQRSEKTLRLIELLYKEDSYHSLSIEGYHVTMELIEKIQRGEWSPETEVKDTAQKDALAAKGYHEAFKSVVQSVTKVLQGASPGAVFYDDIQNWYRELFKPIVQAGILNPGTLAGYRKSQVYISGARHVPPPPDAVLDSMETLEKLLKEESSAAVRAILGHFIFVFIHPYMDGNGRIGRFIMNLMLISGGYNWTVITTSERFQYMAALESASVNCNIVPFAHFIQSETEYWKQRSSQLVLRS
ncbi:MAG TPA: Fic family protein [Pseudobdellovibrionaceae bacterium]